MNPMATGRASSCPSCAPAWLIWRRNIRRGGRGRLIGAVVFDEESDVPMILVVNHGNWHWVM